MLKKNYDEKCDVWSCGVILHILLCGYPPFRGKTEKEILEKVETGYFSLSGPEWKTVSSKAKMLLKLLLTYEAKERVSAEQALNHSWIQIHTKIEAVTHRDAQLALQALRNFHVSFAPESADRPQAAAGGVPVHREPVPDAAGHPQVQGRVQLLRPQRRRQHHAGGAA